MPTGPSWQQQWTLAIPLLLLAWAGRAGAQLEPPGYKLSEHLLQRYLSNAELAAWLQEFNHKCANISRVLSIGKSSEGHDLWVLEVSDNPGREEPEPRFKYLANMHGDEPSGRALLPQLAEWLCAHYGSDARATRLVEKTHLFIMPTMNPDGFARRRRENGRGYDLNRNFPDPIELRHDVAALRRPLPDAQPETKAMMAWLLEKQFTAAANLHEGAVCANYPYDGYNDMSMSVTGVRNPAPDDAAFVHLAKTYAAAHASMSKSAEFKDGITNGAQWYPVYGGMQDWSYVAAGCMDITLELSDSKWRPEGDLQQLWEDNRDALLALPLAAMLGGVHGRVTAAGGAGQPLPATIMVQGIARNSSADSKFGYYNRPLAPGVHNITAVLPGYQPSHATVRVPADGSGAVQDFSLQRLSTAAGQPAAAAAWAGQQQGPWRAPSLLHAVRPHHVLGLAMLGLAVCGAGGLAVYTVLSGRRQGAGLGGGLAARPQYELVQMQERAAPAAGPAPPSGSRADERV